MSSFVVYNKLQKKFSKAIFSGYYAPEKIMTWLFISLLIFSLQDHNKPICRSHRCNTNRLQLSILLLDSAKCWYNSRSCPLYNPEAGFKLLQVMK